MGRGRGGSRTQRRHFRQNRDNVWKRSKPDPSDTNGAAADPSWQPFATQSLAFEQYYKEQGIVAPEEWDLFIEFLRKPLPAAFRINSSSQFCSDIRTQLESDFMISLQSEVSEGGEPQPIRPLAWYPENLAWHSNFSRMQLRKNQTLERFHEFLKLENEIGNITRQEAVSMVPPLFLDVRPEHFILDMCAAPGSKTFQLLEIIHRSTKPGLLPDGLIVANDLDVQRCNLLIHQTKRMCTANLIVTNHEAQHFPGCRSNKKSASAPDTASKLEPPISQLLFDRVLCDVPCSGDGTLRKAPDIWRKWHSGHGNGLHALQVQIAMRGLSLLKVGGRMVYSTCSMNPVENEAVVGEILRKCGGSVELIDVSSELPQLVRRPGLTRWKVRDKGKWLASSKDIGKYRTNAISIGMFPSGRNLARRLDQMGSMEQDEKHEDGEDEDVVEDLDSTEDAVISDAEEVSPFPLERCMRIVPHDQNGGAFFIAVLHKHSPLPANHGTANLHEGASTIDEEPINLPTSLAVDSDERTTDAASESELIEDEQDGVTVELDASGKNEENGSEANQVPDDKEVDPKKTPAKRKQLQGKWKGVDPVVFFKDETIINAIKTFYGIDESFPFNGHLVTRNSDTNNVKRIYYVSKPAKDVLELNFYVGEQLKITSIGLKMFERQTASVASCAPCAFRISSEGLPLILPYITKQILYASPVDFKHILQYKSIKFSDFVDPEFGAKASSLMLGCCVLVLNKGGKSSLDPIQVDESTIAIGCWKGKNSLSVMVTALDCQELLERLLVRFDIGNGSFDIKDEASNGNGEEVDMKDVENNDDKENMTAATELDDLNEKTLQTSNSGMCISESGELSQSSNVFKSYPFRPLESHGLLSERMKDEFKSGEEYWALERKLCHALTKKLQISVEDVIKAINLKSFDNRVLNLLLYGFRGEKINELHMKFLSVSEFLVEVADDLTLSVSSTSELTERCCRFDYEEDVMENNFNILRMFIRIFGTSAPTVLAKYIAEAEENYNQVLKALDPQLSMSYQRRCVEATEEGGNASGHPLGTWNVPPLILDEEFYRSNLLDTK